MNEQPQWEGPNGPWNRIETNIDYVYAIDNAVPEWMIKSLEEQFYRVPMEWNHYSTPASKPFFGRTFYNNRTGQNEQAPYGVYALFDLIKYHVIKAVDPEAEFVDLMRINLNGYPRGFGGSRHVDYDDDVRIWSVVYFLNDSDGDTRFWKAPGSPEIVIDAGNVKGRLLMFPACYDHEALAPNKDLRLTLNFCFRMNSKLNELAYIGSGNL